MSLGQDRILELMEIVGEMITLEDARKKLSDTVMIPQLQNLFTEIYQNKDTPVSDFTLHVYRHIYLFGFMDGIMVYDTAVERGIDPITLLTQDEGKATHDGTE